MASAHWSERGQLLDLSRDWRAQRKKSRLARAGHEDRMQRDSSAPAISRSSPQSDPEGPKLDRHSPPASRTPSGPKNRVERGVSNVDMYMSLDGSAITAIGSHSPFFRSLEELMTRIHRHASARASMSCGGLGSQKCTYRSYGCISILRQRAFHTWRP